MKDKLAELINEVTNLAPIGRAVIPFVAEYLLANGVVVLPCKIGATAYAVCEREVCHEMGNEIEYFISPCYLNSLETIAHHNCCFGHSLFPTKNAAEAEVKRRKASGYRPQ